METTLDVIAACVKYRRPSPAKQFAGAILKPAECGLLNKTCWMLSNSTAAAAAVIDWQALVVEIGPGG